jgi:hypothetical protein
VHIIDLTYVGLGIHEELAAYVADQQNYYEQEGVHVALRDGRAWDGGTAPAQAAGLSPARQVRRSLQERSRSGGRNARIVRVGPSGVKGAPSIAPCISFPESSSR